MLQLVKLATILLLLWENLRGFDTFCEFWCNLHHFLHFQDCDVRKKKKSIQLILVAR